MSGLTLTWVFLLSSIPTFLHRPYRVPLGIPNSAAAFWTGIPPLMASRAVLRSSWVRRERSVSGTLSNSYCLTWLQVVATALNG